MQITDLIGGGAIETLEMSVRFAGARQRVIASNVANISTPNHIPYDLSPEAFQKSLRAAVERRRAESGQAGRLRLESNDEMRIERDGDIRFNPRTASGNILFHDRNNRDLERLMQANAENVGAFRVAIDLLRTRYEVVRSAIAERP